MASLVGVGPVFTLALVTGTVIMLAQGAAAAAVGVVALVLVVLVCVTLARAVATASVRLLTSRRGRDLAVLSGLFIALGSQGVNIAAQKLGRPDGLTVLEPLGAVLRWVPPASAMAAVDDAGRGSYGSAAVGLALTALALALLLWWWQRTLTALMTSPDSSTLQAVEKDSARRSGGGERGLARLLPDGRTGTVMLRTLRYAWRDPKSKMGWATALGVGLLVPVVSSLQGRGSIYTAFSASALLGMQMYNQFGQDTSAFWMVASTIATPRDAYEELRARAMTLALVAVPYVTLVVIGTAALIGPWSDFLEVYGLSLALLGALLATGALSSALFPYSIPSEGNKNIAPGQGAIAWFSLFGGLLVGAVLSAPMLGLTIWLHVVCLLYTWRRGTGAARGGAPGGGAAAGDSGGGQQGVRGVGPGRWAGPTASAAALRWAAAGSSEGQTLVKHQVVPRPRRLRWWMTVVYSEPHALPSTCVSPVLYWASEESQATTVIWESSLGPVILTQSPTCGLCFLSYAFRSASFLALPPFGLVL